MHTPDLFQRRGDFFLSVSPQVRGAVVLSMVLGLVGVGVGAAMFDPVRVWGAVLMNVFFFFSIALGGLAFGAMQDVISAVWGRPIRRLHESFGAFLPVAAITFAIFLLCVLLEIGSAHKVYRWIANPGLVAGFYGKEFWLQKQFMVVRDLAAIIVLCALAFWQMRQLLARDQAFVAGDQGQAAVLAKSVRARLQYWSAPLLIVYALIFSLLAFDLMMTLSPLWFSTLFAGWMFAIMMQTLCATLLIMMFALRHSSIGSVMQQQQFHDVGKLMHGFTIFFAYLTYAHVLTYWYGNVPEETEYFLHRMHAPWIYLVLGAPIFSFVIPFFSLIFKVSKWTAAITIPICVSILAAQWVAILLVVMPEVVDAAKWHFPVVELGTFFLFLGLFLASIMWFGKRYPMVPVADPLLIEALEGGH